MSAQAQRPSAPPQASGAAAGALPLFKPHSRFDDLLALVTGSLLVAFGVVLFQAAHLLTGGTAGLAFVIHYVTGRSFGTVFFLLNLPFYFLSLRELGREFTIKTFIAVGLLSLATEAIPHWFTIGRLDPLFGGVIAGALVGVGLLILFRHHASLGGFSILAVWLQRRRGWRAGWVQLALDSLILLAALGLVDGWRVLCSLLGAVVLNLTIAQNHRPGRYLGI